MSARLEADDILFELGNLDAEPVVFFMEQHGATLEAWCPIDNGSQMRKFWKGETIREALEAAWLEIEPDRCPDHTDEPGPHHSDECCYYDDDPVLAAVPLPETK
jgi:hypothetical protein